MEKGKYKEETNTDRKEIDYFEYSNQPEKLFPIAQEKFNIN